MDAIAAGPGVVHFPPGDCIERVPRLLIVSFVPLRIAFPLKLTRHFLSSKITSQPALHRMRIPINDAIFISGTLCPIKVWGRPGMTKSHV